MAKTERKLRTNQFVLSWRVGALVLTAAGSTLFTASGAMPLPCAWYDAAILRPLRYPFGHYAVREVDGIKYEDAYFPSANGNTLHGWFFKKPGAPKTVLLSHGIGGNISSRVDLIQLFLQANTSVFIYDYEGYGRSSGRASLRNIVNDGQAAYNYLTEQRGIKPSEIILAGESLGTGVTCSLSQHVKAAAMILQSPFSSLAKRCAEVVPFLTKRPDWLQPTRSLSNDLVLQKPHPPVLIVHGDRDTTVPVSHAINLYNEAVGPKELLVIDGAGHTGDPNLMYSPEYLSAVRDFLSTIDHQNAARKAATKTHVSSVPSIGVN